MFATYFDESLDKEKRILVVCALVAFEEDIRKLERSWVDRLEKTNKRLISSGRKPISRYHASEMNALDNEFDGWDADESKEFSKQLLKIIRNRHLYAVAHAVILKDFCKVYSNVRDDPRGWAYHHAMLMCLTRIGDYFGPNIPKEKHITEGISVIFDRTQEFKSRADSAFENITNDPTFKYRDCFNSIAQGNSSAHIALQPADLLAYEIMRETSRKLFSSSRGMRIFFKKMVGGNRVKVSATYSDERYFRELSELKQRAPRG